MFAAHCTAEGRTVLLSERRITDLRVEPGRVVVAFTCWCGHEGVLIEHRSPVGHPVDAEPGASMAAPTVAVDPAERPSVQARRPVAAAAAA